ncbi:MAG: hypothetical protein ABSF71_09055 [Terriglobia bacterium]
MNPDQGAKKNAIDAEGRAPSRHWLYGIWVAMAAGLMWYAQTLAFNGDEGFHLLAAQLIKGGLRPYLDFCFPQTPLNAYWNAFLLRLLGDTWRAPHALAALETSAATVLAAQFVLARLPERAWQAAGAIAATIMIGCNINLVKFGSLGQAYGISLFMTVCAFRVALLAVERRGWWLAFVCGALAGAAVASSLLTAAVAPVIVVWIWWYNRAGSRLVKIAAFAGGTAIPFLPVIWLAVQSPWVVWFNIAKYQLYYRAVYWPHPLTHDLKTMTGWLVDPQSLLLGLPAIFGVLYIAKRSAWPPERRAEFYLCAWLAIGIAAELAFAHPTFARYFCLITPFVGILAIPGLFAIASLVLRPEKPFWPVFIPSILCAGALARSISDNMSDTYAWKDYEAVAQKVLEVTAPGKQIFADEKLYFLMKRRPPSGMEFGYSHKLTLPRAVLAELHVISMEVQKRQLAAGAFASACACGNDVASDYDLDRLFHQRVNLKGCSVFWNWKPPCPGRDIARNHQRAVRPRGSARKSAKPPSFLPGGFAGGQTKSLPSCEHPLERIRT